MNLIRTLIRKLEALIVRFSLIGNTPFYDRDQFPWVKPLESNWKTIRQELEKILEYGNALPNFQDISPQQSAITQDDRWKTYFFYGYGIKADRNCERCPETTRLIENVPGMKTAFFSILLPHKHIPEHRGYYKGVIRYHLGLIVPHPQESCGIRVGNEVGYWEEGKSLIFDDTFQHEAWNDTNGIRVVLFLDVIRPMAFPFSVLNQLFIKLISWSPLVQDAHLNQKKWDEILEQRSSEQNKQIQL